jgi:hypothetical protein
MSKLFESEDQIKVLMGIRSSRPSVEEAMSGDVVQYGREVNPNRLGDRGHETSMHDDLVLSRNLLQESLPGELHEVGAGSVLKAAHNIGSKLDSAGRWLRSSGYMGRWLRSKKKGSPEDLAAERQKQKQKDVLATATAETGIAKAAKKERDISKKAVSSGEREKSPGEREKSPGEREKSPGEREKSPGKKDVGFSAEDAKRFAPSTKQAPKMPKLKFRDPDADRVQRTREKFQKAVLATRAEKTQAAASAEQTRKQAIRAGHAERRAGVLADPRMQALQRSSR